MAARAVVRHEYRAEPPFLDERDRLGLAQMLLGVVSRRCHLAAELSDREVLGGFRQERLSQEAIRSVDQSGQLQLLLLPRTLGADRPRPADVLAQERSEHRDQPWAMEVHEDRRVVEEQQGRVGHR